MSSIFYGRGTPMIYLDHGATSFPKPKGVIEEMEKCMRYYCGNPGRSGHQMSMIIQTSFYKEYNGKLKSCIARMYAGGRSCGYHVYGA